MEKNPIIVWKKSGDRYKSQTIPKDCLRLIFKYPAFDLQSMCLLSKTCKNFHAYFEDMIIQSSVCNNADTKCMDILIKNNSAKCTKMLISYAIRFKEAEVQFKDEEQVILNYSYDDYPEAAKKKVFLLMQEKMYCKNLFDALYQYSAQKRNELNIKIRDANVEISPLQIYSGEFFTSDLKSKAFFAFLREKEFDLMLQVVRKNVDFFRTYYCKDQYHVYHILHYVYEQEGIELVKKIAACGIDIKTPLELRNGSAYYTLLYAGYKKNDQEMIDLLLKAEDKYKQGMKSPLDLSEMSDVATGKLKKINQEQAKLLLSQYYTQEDKDELLKDALTMSHHYDTCAWVQTLLNCGANLKSLPLYLLCSYGDLDVVKSVFTEKSLNASQYKVEEQFRIIYYSMDSGNLLLLDFICGQGFHPDITYDTYDKTALHWAVLRKQWESAKILLKYGANINNNRIIDICFESERYQEQVQFLVDNGIDIDNIIARINRYKKNYWKNALEYFMNCKIAKKTDLGVIENPSINIADKISDQKDDRDKTIELKDFCNNATIGNDSTQLVAQNDKHDSKDDSIDQPIPYSKNNIEVLKVVSAAKAENNTESVQYSKVHKFCSFFKSFYRPIYTISSPAIIIAGGFLIGIASTLTLAFFAY